LAVLSACATIFGLYISPPSILPQQARERCLSAGQMEFPFALGNPRSASLFWIPKAQVELRGEIYGFWERPEEAALV